MRALVVEELAENYRGMAEREVDTPQPGPGEVLVKVCAAAVNFPDLLQSKGAYQHRPDLPFVAGMELSGVVVEAGEDCGFAVGDSVVGRGRPGAFAEYSAGNSFHAKPARLSHAEAAGFGVAYMTAWVALVRRAAIQPGEWVLVHGAAGGVGLAAVDLAKALGARVIAAGASAEKLAVVEREYAPDAVVDVTQGFRERVKAITGGRGADVIYDPVGGDVFDESVRCIAFNGRLLSIGFTSGRIPTLPVNMALIKGFSLMGVRAGEFGRQFPELGRQDREAIWRMAEEGRLRPRVHAEYPLERWREAYELLEHRQVIGKAIIRPDL